LKPWPEQAEARLGRDGRAGLREALAHPLDGRVDEGGVGISGRVGVDDRAGEVRARLQPVQRIT
jgi:hypothetical protein